MNDWTSLGALGALAAGVSGSLHCALMCGPLACAVGQRSTAAAVSWHAGRWAAYSLLGLVLGATGSVAVQAFAKQAEPVLPWLMALGLVATALELPKRLPAVWGFKAIAGWLHRQSAKLAPGVRAGAIGASTPFLPCGLVYGISLAALASGSAVNGALVMSAFALGGIPALAAAQFQLAWLQRFRGGTWLRRALPLVAAAILVVRAITAHTAAETGAVHGCH